MAKTIHDKKFTASHTAAISAAHAPLRAAAKLACVSKISLGMIKPIGNGPLGIKFLDEGPGCLLAKIRGPRSIQEIRIYTNDREATEAAMRAALA